MKQMSEVEEKPFTSSLNAVQKPACGKVGAQVKFGVRSPKSILAPVDSCGHWLRHQNSPSPPPAFGLIYEVAIGQPR